MENPTSPASRPDFYDFLDRMRRPAAADLFRSIKSFLVSFSFHEANAEEDASKVQAFLAEMEGAIRDHPLWANASNQEIDHALEVPTDFFLSCPRFGDALLSAWTEHLSSSLLPSRPGEICHDQTVRPFVLFLTGRCCGRQGDIGEDSSLAAICQASALGHTQDSAERGVVAVKELQKINSFKAPREKLLCIMSCCQVINNLLLNISMSNDRTLSGADEFLPILIYITIKANPPQLHSNLKFVQLFRRETKLVSEVEYYLTNLISAKMFVLNVNARSLSMEESEFQKHMELARLSYQVSVARPSSSQGLATSAKVLPEETDLSGYEFPFMDSDAENLTPVEVKQLHDLYKKVVTRYTMLSKALRKLSMDEDRLLNSVHDS